MIGRRSGLILFVALLVALAGYGVVSTPKARPVAGIGSVDAFACGVPTEFLSVITIDTPQPPPPALPRPAPGTIPESFTPVEAVVCGIGIGDRVGADGTTSYLELHYAGDFGKAVKEFNAPSARPAILPGACGTYSSVSPPIDMWLVDAEGRAVQPSYPTSDCGYEDTRGLYEVQQLVETAAIEHPVRIDTEGIGLYFSCTSVPTPAAPGPLSAEGLPFSPSGFCRFDTSGPVPVFDGAERYEATTDMGGIFARSLPAPPCAERATSMATTSTYDADMNNWATVEIQIELDGCRRILADGYVPLTAPDELVSAITARD